ncbi:MAG: vWA domain-containing protein, partial [Acidimicrobiales bacterium]
GQPDLRVTMRRALRTDGEPVRAGRRAPSRRPRRTVIVADVSGSMEPYARAVLRFAQVAVAARGPGRVEAFALGTRLTRLTREMEGRDPDAALRRATASVADWSGGTRLGDGLRVFNDRWGTRGMARGAVVVIVSDGWDRGDPEQLAAEMGRLQRVAHRVVWVNPLKASPGYAPLARGMAAALPYVDEFVEGHSLASLQGLAVLIGGSDR